MKRLFLVVPILAVAFLFSTAASCDDTPNDKDAQLVRSQQDIYSKAQPVPVFDYSQTRATLIQIYEAKTKAVSTFSVVTSQMGQVLFTCDSFGFPIPADTQLTNPLTHESGGIVLDQAEPDGTFTSQNTDGTYVVCAREDGSVAPIYTEGKVTTFTFPVKVENGQIVDAGGQSTANIKVSR